MRIHAYTCTHLHDPRDDSAPLRAWPAACDRGSLTDVGASDAIMGPSSPKAPLPPESSSLAASGDCGREAWGGAAPGDDELERTAAEPVRTHDLAQCAEACKGDASGEWGSRLGVHRGRAAGGRMGGAPKMRHRACASG